MMNSNRMILSLVAALVLLMTIRVEAWQEKKPGEKPGGWPVEVDDITFQATADGSPQHAMYWSARSNEPRPLLVALHSWSGGYKQSAGVEYATRSMARNWHFIHPDFRGVNQRPQATCSDFVVSDILDAVEYAKRQGKVDSSRIYLVGGSGGGMASLMMLAKAPNVWAGVSCWVPISNLADWHAETKARKLRYTAMVKASCNGIPGESAAVNFQYWNRSPINFLSRGKGVPLDLNAGIHDGHTGSVPIGHSLNAFNVLANAGDRVDEISIELMTREAAVLPNLQWKGTDSSYDDNVVLFRRQSGAARLSLFEGGHEILHDAAFHWLATQKKQTTE